ncbi:spermatogenesis-associated serine-rich protein 2 isoform X2 [Aplysia californica]|nr:spermatogenesis-associated serine-rich protein 2 isoform X2 [Aplysia californica]
MAETSHDNVKEKVQAVREVVPGKSNNEVVLVLQYYDYNVERAIQAYLEDGAKEALKEWNFTGSKQPNKKRKNKKKGAGDKTGDKPDVSLTSSTAANGKGEPVVNGKIGVPNGEIAHGPEQSESESPLDSPTSPPPDSVKDSTASKRDSGSNRGPTPASSSASTATATATTTASVPQRQPHGKGRGHHDSHHSHHHHGNARERTTSEMSTGSGYGDGHRRPFQGLEKAFKDLQRQTTSLERLRHLLDHEIDRSYKSVKSVFEELRKGLSDRESQLVAEMDLLKKEASDMLEMRQHRASDLKRQCERSEQLKEAEVNELRADIKHFVIERRHDEELGRTTRFLFDSDLLLGEIQKFGEVVHVKSLYTARRPSASSVASSVSHDENHEDDLSQSWEVTELQDRLRTSLKLQSSTSDRSPPSRNGPSDGDFIPSRSYRNRQPNGGIPAKQSDPARGPRQSGKPGPGSPVRPVSSSASSSTRSDRPSSGATGSPGRGGRGRGRGRGGRGGGQGRGRGQGGERPPSSASSQRPSSGSGSQPRSSQQARVVVSAISD